jgi:hypothetical protein
MRSTHLPLLLLLLLATPALAQPRETIRLDELVAELRKDPNAAATIDAMLAGMGQGAGAGGMLTPEQRERLRAALQEAVRTGDTRALERSPALTVSQMGLATSAISAANAGSAQPAGIGQAPSSARAIREPLGIPVTAPPPAATPVGPVHPALAGVGIGKRDVPDPDLQTRAQDSGRLAEVLNRLAINPAGRPRTIITSGDGEASTPADLLRLLVAQGHTVEVTDARYFADFAGLESKGRDLAAPLWVDTEVQVPGRGRTLRVPVTHSQHELIVRGPVVNADVSFFMGIDGEAKFRAMVGSRADWTGRRVGHVYQGDRAVEAMRVAGEVRRAFEEKRLANPQLPYGGYFTLGVCNDSNAFVEYALTGKTTLYPLTRDLSYYPGPGEIDRISRAMPVDGRGQPADLERILASIPEEDFEDLAFPGLRDDLRALRAATGQQPSGRPQQGLTDELERSQRGR